MDTDEIKQELPIYNQQCSACLTVGRQLSPLGQFTDIFKMITANLYQPASVSGVILCWECLSLLQKVSRFQEKVWRANHLLKLQQNSVNMSLSTLITVLYDDKNSHSVCVSEKDIEIDKNTNEQKKIQLDEVQINIDENELNEIFIEENVMTDDCIQNIKGEKEMEDIKEKKKARTRWARHRILQNKKTKFKLLTDTKPDDIFVRVRIGDQEVDASAASERDREYKCSKWKCDRCIQGFHEERKLLMHNKYIHSKNRQTYICHICYLRSKNKRHLVAHITNHYYKFVCTLCDYSTTKKTQMQHHLIKRHKKIYQCTKCKLKFGNRWDFYKHFKKTHNQYICDYCGRIFKMKYCVAEHIRKRHSPYECKACDKRFARYNGLWMHNKIRHPPPSTSTSPRPPPAAAYCVECDRQYQDEYRYKWHLASSARHRPRRPRRYPCPDCDKVFSKNIYMKEHRDLVHLKHYKYRCELCDKNYLRNAALLKHNQRTHEGILPPRNKICYVCGRGFTTNKILQNHARTHTGERPFACSLCHARFLQLAALHAHARARHPAPARRQPTTECQSPSQKVKNV